MSNHRKDNMSQIWDDMDQMRTPKNRLAGIFDQLQPAVVQEESLLVPQPSIPKKNKVATADKKNG